MPGSLRAAFGAGTPRQPLTHVHQLLLRVEFLGAAVPVAVGLIHGLALGFPILLLQLFPNIQHAQQGVLGEQGQVSAPRYPTGAVLGAWDVRGGSHGPGCTWVPVDAGLEMSPSDRSSGNLAVRGLLRLHSSFSCCRGRESGKQ